VNPTTLTRQHVREVVDLPQHRKQRKNRSGPVVVSYLPGMEPKRDDNERFHQTKFPFTAYINGKPRVYTEDAFR